MTRISSFKFLKILHECFAIEREAVSLRYSVKKVFLKFLQDSHENTCVRVSFLIKLQAPQRY